MSEYNVYKADTLDKARLTVQPQRRTGTSTSQEYYRRLIIPLCMQPCQTSVMTFPLYGVHIPPSTTNLCSVGYPLEFKTAVETALERAFQGYEDLPVNFGDDDYCSHQLWFKSGEVKQAKAISTHGSTDLVLSGYSGDGLMGTAHLCVFLSGELPKGSGKVVPDSWTLHIEVHVLHATGFSRPQPVSAIEIASKEFLDEISSTHSPV